MIANNRELEVVRRQLALAESALASLHDRVYSKNPRNYAVYAEGPVDMILKLRSEIDAYLGIEPEVLIDDAFLSISLEGARVRLGEVSVGVVVRYVNAFRRGFRSIVRFVAKHRMPGVVRTRRQLETLCRLTLAGVGPGSVGVFLNEPSDLGLFSDEQKQLFQQSLSLLFDGLEFAGDDSSASREPFESLDERTRRRLLEVVRRLLPSADGNVDAVSVRLQPREANQSVRRSRLTRTSRDRVLTAMSRPEQVPTRPEE